MNYETLEEYAAARRHYFETHPEAPVTKGIECLNLIMKREYAEQILAGTKKLEYRSYSKHYVTRLIDRDTADYIRMHINDEDVLTFFNDIRQVKKIHFHNYNNSWFLDVECTFNDAFSITKDDIEFMQAKYGVHDFDDDLAYFEKTQEKNRPYLFYFVIGNILATNLK